MKKTDHISEMPRLRIFCETINKLRFFKGFFKKKETDQKI